MEQFQPMSDSEAQVMDVLWNAEEAMTSAQVIDALRDRTGWKPSTVWTFLGRLTDKGLLRARRVGKANYYAPALSAAEYAGARTEEFLRTVHKGSVKSFFAALSGGRSLDPDEISALRGWLEEQTGGED